jgi:2-amino-4-hydroxy-6-hydroxymethyldihydropteridine diphosphokinase
MLALISLGSNLGDPARNIEMALEQMRQWSDEPLLRSSFWNTSAVDCPPGTPDFINAAARLKTRPEETPETLLRRMLALEAAFGRPPIRGVNEARLLDLDLIAFGGEVRNSPELQLPHPRAHLRGFVLAPLAEIAPDFQLPPHGRTVRELLEGLEAGMHATRVQRPDGSVS